MLRWATAFLAVAAVLQAVLFAHSGSTNDVLTIIKLALPSFIAPALVGGWLIAVMGWRRPLAIVVAYGGYGLLLFGAIAAWSFTR